MPIEHALTKAELANARQNDRLMLVAGVEWQGKMVEFRHVAFLLAVTDDELVIGFRDALRFNQLQWDRHEHCWVEEYGNYWLEGFEPWEEGHIDHRPAYDEQGHRFVRGFHAFDAARFTDKDQKLHETVAEGAGFPVRQLAEDDSHVVPDFGPRNKQNPRNSVIDCRSEEVEAEIEKLLADPIYETTTIRGPVKIIKAGRVPARWGSPFVAAHHVYSVRDEQFLQANLSAEWLVRYLAHVAQLGAY